MFPPYAPTSSSSSASKALWLTIVTVTAALVLLPTAAGNQLSLPFMGLHDARVMTFNGKTQRDIVVTFVKNISENAPKGLVLASFRAQDTASSNQNLTYAYC